MIVTQANVLSRVLDHVDAAPEKLFAVTCENGGERRRPYAALWSGAQAFARTFAERGVPASAPS